MQTAAEITRQILAGPDFPGSDPLIALADLVGTLEQRIDAQRQLANATSDRLRELADGLEETFSGGFLPNNFATEILRAVADTIDPPLLAPTPATAHCPECDCPAAVEEHATIAGLLTCTRCGLEFAEQDVDSTGPPTIEVPGAKIITCDGCEREIMMPNPQSGLFVCPHCGHADVQPEHLGE
jgi:ribosomal protein L37AE/L43A